jgi:cytochrome c-type biogenesis protein CcmE
VKKTHIALLFFLAAGFVALASMLGQSAKLGGFDDALAAEGKPVRVTGQLAEGKPVEYDPEVDANSFRFWMVDRQGVESEVVCFDDMPYDFEKSEEVVLTGAMKEGVFYATYLLVKCPSKYVEEDLAKAAG